MNTTSAQRIIESAVVAFIFGFVLGVVVAVSPRADAGPRFDYEPVAQCAKPIPPEVDALCHNDGDFNSPGGPVEQWTCVDRSGADWGFMRVKGGRV